MNTVEYTTGVTCHVCGKGEITVRVVKTTLQVGPVVYGPGNQNFTGYSISSIFCNKVDCRILFDQMVPGHPDLAAQILQQHCEQNSTGQYSLMGSEELQFDFDGLADQKSATIIDIFSLVPYRY